MTPDQTQTELNTAETCTEAGPVLIHIGSLLLSSGANTERTRTTLNRIAEALGLQAEIFITHQTIQLYLSPKGKYPIYHQLKRSFSYSNNFTLLSGISRMSWKVVEEHWSLSQIKAELNRLQSLKPYQKWMTVIAVATAGAAFCRLLGGDLAALVATFMATLVGQLVHHQMKRAAFNSYLCVYFAAMSASIVSLLFFRMDLGGNHEQLLPASLIFLIPGVPLINSFSDFIDGNILNGLLRTVNGLMIAFAIAMGLLTALLFVPLS